MLFLLPFSATGGGHPGNLGLIVRSHERGGDDMGRLVCCLLLLLIADAKGDELFVAHSRDNPSPLWADLDATVEETQRDGRVSIFKVHRHRRVVGAADGRFFICTVLLLAKQRGYVNFSNAEPIDGRSVVIFLKEHDEDVQGLIDSEYREYEFFERVDAEGFALLEQLCVTATSQ